MRNVVKSVLMAFLALAILVFPVVASEDVSNTLEVDVDTTYPVHLTWALEADASLDDFTDGDLEADWVLGRPETIVIKSECSENLNALFLHFKVKQSAVEITPVGFSAEVSYNSSAKAYVVGPEGGFAFNSTNELCFDITPLERGYYTLSVRWVKEA